MIPSHAIVHVLNKNVGAPASITLRATTLTQNNSLDRLTDELLSAYSKKSTKGLGSFDPDTDTYRFSALLDTFLNDRTADSFIDFTKKAMNIIESRATTATLAKGGYVLFIFYTSDEKDYLFLTILRQSKGCTITPNLEISDTEHLEIDKIHTGCHIDISEWKNSLKEEGTPPPYITFIKGRSNQQTPQYFLLSIGCAEFTDAATQTQEIIRALKDFADHENLNADQRREMQQRAYSYCAERENIALDVLSTVINDIEPEKFLTFVNEGGYKVGNGFTPHKTILKKLKEITAKGDGIRITFPASMLGDRIIYKEENNEKSLTIRNPPQSIISAIKDAM